MTGRMKVVGMISGTSFDGIDVATADLSFDHDKIVLRPYSSATHPYPSDLTEMIATALPPQHTTAHELCVLDTRIGQVFAEAASQAAADGADLIVSHGQTIYHWVDGRSALGTIQLGQPAWIGAATGLPVVSDLRMTDIAHGGQGAPLASLMDVLLLGRDGPEPRAALNLGGIANITITGGGVEPVAFDTGPANALLDVAVRELTGGEASFDKDGTFSAGGTVDEKLLADLLDEPYYALAPPKSTGKEVFHREYLLSRLGSRVIDADVLATLAALTAETVARWCRDYNVTELVAAGGGVDNPTVMGEIAGRLPSVRLRRIDEYGLPASAKEAYLFALLGFLTVHGLPGTIASCTGARQASILGTVLPGRDGLPSMPRPSVVPTRLRIDPEVRDD